MSDAGSGGTSSKLAKAIGGLTIMLGCAWVVMALWPKSPPVKPVAPIPVPAVNIEEMAGKKIDVLIQHFGLPDGGIGPVNNFQTKFVGMHDAVVVFVYASVGENVYVARDSSIIKVTSTKESLSWPDGAPEPQPKSEERSR